MPPKFSEDAEGTCLRDVSLYDKKPSNINTASASKVGQFRPFWGEVKKLKGPLMSIFLFQIQECESTTLETTLDAFCERSFNLLDATNAAI